MLTKSDKNDESRMKNTEKLNLSMKKSRKKAEKRKCTANDLV